MGSLFCAVSRKEGVAGANRRESCQKSPAGKTIGNRNEGVAGPKGRKEAKKAPPGRRLETGTRVQRG